MTKDLIFKALVIGYTVGFIFGVLAYAAIALMTEV